MDDEERVFGADRPHLWLRRPPGTLVEVGAFELKGIKDPVTILQAVRETGFRLSEQRGNMRVPRGPL